MSLLPPSGHGGDGLRLALRLGVSPDEVLDLSLSLNPIATDVRPLVAAAADEVVRYPDDEAATAAVAAALGVDDDRVVLTNGGAEAIALVAAEHPVGRVDEPEFSLYARHLSEVRSDGARWRSNPHNPTGRLARVGERAAVWDEAFHPLAAGRWSRGDPDAIVVGSLTKAFACPGLRVGYVVTPDVAGAASIRSRRPEWSVNALACAVVPALMDLADPPRWTAQIAELRRDLVAVLADYGLKAETSDANFAWVPDAAGWRDRLLHERIVVRSGISFGHPDAVRIAVPGPEGLERLAAALTRLT